MTVVDTANQHAVRTLLRWRARMIRNSIKTDSGFFSIFLGGLLYLAIILVVSFQARAGGMLTRELGVEDEGLALSLMGMHLFVVVCIQGGALYFFRISLQGDFRTARWRNLPVGRETLRRAYLVDSLLNPGAIAALFAAWMLVFAYSRPVTALSIVACLLVGPTFVYLSQTMLLLASDLMTRFRVAGSWLLFLMIAGVGAFLSAAVVGMASGAMPSLLRDFMLNGSTRLALRLPPWGVPTLVLARMAAGQRVQVVAILIAAVIGGSLLLAVANRIAATTELD